MRCETAPFRSHVATALAQHGLMPGLDEPAVKLLADIVANADGMVGVMPADVLDLIDEWPHAELLLTLYTDAWPRSQAFDRTGSPAFTSLRSVVAEIAGGPELTLHEVARCAEALQSWLAPDVELVMGTRTDAALVDRVTLRLVGWEA